MHNIQRLIKRRESSPDEEGGEKIVVKGEKKRAWGKREGYAGSSTKKSGLPGTCMWGLHSTRCLFFCGV